MFVVRPNPRLERVRVAPGDDDTQLGCEREIVDVVGKFELPLARLESRSPAQQRTGPRPAPAGAVPLDGNPAVRRRLGQPERTRAIDVFDEAGEQGPVGVVHVVVCRGETDARRAEQQHLSTGSDGERGRIFQQQRPFVVGPSCTHGPGLVVTHGGRGHLGRPDRQQVGLTSSLCASKAMQRV
jgi:hypothetical protein